MKSAARLGLMAVALMLSGCTRSQTSETIHYKMTSYFETSSGSRTFSTVFEVTARSHNNPFWSGRDSWTGLGCRVKGDAIGPIAALGNLFILTGQLNETVGTYHCNLMKKYFKIENGPKWTQNGAVDLWRPAWAEAARSNASVVIEPIDYPSIVRLPDLHNPSLFERVDASSGDVGGGWLLSKIVLQVTEEDASNELKEKMPWLWSTPHSLGKLASEVDPAERFSSDSSDFF